MKPLNLIIPMAGQGKRFRKAGYTTFKPFVPINGKPMIQHVTDAFPESVKKWVITSRALLKDEEIFFLEKNLNCTIIDIPLHEDGPAFSIYQARNILPLDESFFISYCDIAWTWDFGKIASQLDHDGIIYTHTGFHPHLVRNNFSAFCLPQKENPSYLQEIREKGSYTDRWMEEPLSIGVFFVKNGHDMIHAISHLVENNVRVAGEFFPSLMFNHLPESRRKVWLEPLPFYIHWGVPEQLRDFECWTAIIKKDTAGKPESSEGFPENIVCMAGLGERMKSISGHPKALMPVREKPMFQFVMERFPSRSSLIITSPAIAPELDRQGVDANRLFVLERQSKSQYETLELSADLLKKKRDFFLTSCDAYGMFDFDGFRTFTEARNPDAVIFTFRPSLMQQKLAGQHTHVTVHDSRVTAVHIKSKSSPDDLGLAGFFWIKDGKILESLDRHPVSQGEMYVDHLFKHWVDLGVYVAGYTVDTYIHLGTPEEFLEHDYWTKTLNRSALL